MRLRNNPKAKEMLSKSNHVIKTFPFELQEDFILEIGCGKGEMIVKLAEANPAIKYVGIEKFPTVAAIALKRIESQELNNVFLICDDAQNLENIFVGSPKTIWLTFSDPWPKARHEKRRLTSKLFLEKYVKIMSSKTTLKLKTDNDDFFNYSIESLKTNGFKVKNVTHDFHSEACSLNNEKTGYEIKWSSKGKKINYLEARK